ncbi:hypothetical protein KF840_07190 [bacterium]|nr:hypothetical protein [bacterium]
MITATVSGSFHRHLHAIESAVLELTALGVRVLSPADPRIVGANGEFLFVASDRVRSVRLVQDRHLQAIEASGFLWLVDPDGYVGQSASLEIGFAIARGIPVLSTTLPSDLTLRQYVHQVSSARAALSIGRVASPTYRRQPNGFLIDPHASIEQAHESLERLSDHFDTARRDHSYDPAHDIELEFGLLAGFLRRSPDDAEPWS